MFETIVIDNFVPLEEQSRLHDKIMKQCEWKFLKDVSGNENQQYPSHGFVHVLNHPEINYNSTVREFIHGVFKPKFSEIVPSYNSIYYSRIFLQLPLAQEYKKEHNGIHVDLPPIIPHVACVYYVNNSDGDTIIYEQTINDVAGGSQNVKVTEHKRVTPKCGRAVFFDGSRYHCSSQPSGNYRTIINFDLTV